MKKIIFVYFDVENNIAEEILWADHLNDLVYQIKNVPFFVPNIAYGDIITVEKDGDNLYFDSMFKPSEHSTIQIVFFKNEAIKDIIKDIEYLGCSWEGMNNQKLLAIDVPLNINYFKVKEYLNNKFEENILDYKESCLSGTHSKQL